MESGMPFRLSESSGGPSRIRLHSAPITTGYRVAAPIWIADAHRGDGKRFVVRADEKLTAFVELESAIRARPS
jgi:hypothetical protein